MLHAHVAVHVTGGYVFRVRVIVPALHQCACSAALCCANKRWRVYVYVLVGTSVHAVGHSCS